MQASQPLTLLPSPRRTAASQELLRALPVHVKESEWPTAPPLLRVAQSEPAIWLPLALLSAHYRLRHTTNPRRTFRRSAPRVPSPQAGF